MTTFDKTKEALHLPEREYTLGEQSCFNVIAKKLPKAAVPHTKEIVDLVLKHKMVLKQVEAGISFLNNNKFEEQAFCTACGVGVTYD